MFFSRKKFGNVRSIQACSLKKCSGMNGSELGKTLINTAWPLTNQTRAYQQDLETTPEGNHSFKVEHRKQNWGKKLINSGW